MRPIAMSLVLVALAAGSASAGGMSKKDQEYWRKMNPIIEATNSVSRQVLDARARYLRWADAQNGPTCQEKSIGVDYPMQFAEAISKNVGGAAKAKPKMKDIDGPAAQWAAALAKLGELSYEAHKYYNERKYKDDGCARGKTMHVELMTNWQTFADADRSIRAAIQAQEDARDMQELPGLKKKYGLALRYHHRALVIEGKRILRALLTAGEPFEVYAAATAPPEKARAPKKGVDAAVPPAAPDPGPAPAVPDLTALRAQLEAYVKMVAVAKDLADTGKTRVDADISGFRGMPYPASQLAEEAGKVLAHIDGSKPFSDAEKRRLAKNDADFPGTLKRLISSYNSLVDQSNRVTFSGKMK